MRIGVGVPVYNGATHIAEALAALQAQDCDDLTVTVLDNASTDETAAVVRDTIGGDPRFKYILNDATLPVLDNFHRALEYSDSEYFAWRAYDDLSSADYLSHLCALLDDDDSAQLAVGVVRSLKFMPDGTVRERVRSANVLEARGVTAPTQRILGAHAAWVYGLWRRDVLLNEMARVRATYKYAWGADHLFMLRPLLAGRVACDPAAEFVQRSFVNPARRGHLRVANDAELKDRKDTAERLYDDAVAAADLSRGQRIALSLVRAKYIARHTS